MFEIRVAECKMEGARMMSNGLPIEDEPRLEGSICCGGHFLCGDRTPAKDIFVVVGSVQWRTGHGGVHCRVAAIYRNPKCAIGQDCVPVSPSESLLACLRFPMADNSQ